MRSRRRDRIAPKPRSKYLARTAPRSASRPSAPPCGTIPATGATPSAPSRQCVGESAQSGLNRPGSRADQGCSTPAQQRRRQAGRPPAKALNDASATSPPSRADAPRRRRPGRRAIFCRGSVSGNERAPRVAARQADAARSTVRHRVGRQRPLQRNRAKGAAVNSEGPARPAQRRRQTIVFPPTLRRLTG